MMVIFLMELMKQMQINYLYKLHVDAVFDIPNYYQ